MPISPSLSAMAEVYQLSREGGPKSERFTSYVKHAAVTPELAYWNPMASAHALEAVQSLIAMDAERIAFEALRDVQEKCEFDGEITLAIILASKGMWTDRLATEVEHRTSPKRNPGRGGIQLWTREPLTPEDVRREAAAEAVRVIYTALHGNADSLGKVLAREGLAYAPSLNSWAPPVEGRDALVDEALSVLGDSRELGDIAAVLYGDAAAAELGYNQLGLGERTGFRWAAAVAEARIREIGVPNAIRQPGVSTT